MDYTNSTLPPRNGGRVQVAGETQDTERHTTQLWMEITSEPWLLEWHLDANLLDKNVLSLIHFMD